MPGQESTPHVRRVEGAGARFSTCPQTTPPVERDEDDDAPRCLACHRPIVAASRRLPALDVRELTLLSAALDDAVDALDALGGAR